MGESAVLAHSYSFAAPITRNDSHEDNTIHALSQSISFGKFMTENLEWGKWSSFSHKKYVEEAEKYSRPGSVAQKKAFFEAHYKRIAEAKKAVSEEQPAVTPADVLLHALETHPPLNMLQEEDDDEQGERKSSQIRDDVAVVVTDDEKPVVVDDKSSVVTTDDLEEKENGLIGECDKEKKQEVESVDEKKEERRSMTKNKPVFRLSLEKTIPPKAIDTEIGLADKTSERPISQSLEKNEEKPVLRQRFSFFNCFMGNAKTQDQDQRRKKTRTEKNKKKKQFLCFCMKPKNVRNS
ncbi:unnamed protein product [Cochlearia groenlandica]